MHLSSSFGLGATWEQDFGPSDLLFTSTKHDDTNIEHSVNAQ